MSRKKASGQGRGAKKKAAAEHRSCCPVARTLDILGDRWTLLVVRDLFLGRAQFKEFLASPEGIATNILTDRLHRLVEHGLVEKFERDACGGREAYRLTERGRSLEPVLWAIVRWGVCNIPGAEAKLLGITQK